MPTGKKKRGQHDDEDEVRRVSVDVDDDEDFDDLDADDESVVVADDDVDPIVAKLLADSEKKINDRISKIDARLDAHEARIQAVEKKLAITPQAATAAAAPKQEKNLLDTTLDLTFGTAGKVLHGIVDTVSFVTSAAVDLVTLGRARPQAK